MQKNSIPAWSGVGINFGLKDCRNFIGINFFVISLQGQTPQEEIKAKVTTQKHFGVCFKISFSFWARLHDHRTITIFERSHESSIQRQKSIFPQGIYYVQILLVMGWA